MNWDYIAGFIDGEGSIIIKPPRVRIYISNTDKKVLEGIKDFLKCGYVYEVKRKNKPKWKRQYGFTIGDHKGCLIILEKLKGKLIIKKELCDDAIKYIKNKRWFREYVKESELKKLLHLKSSRKIGKRLGISQFSVLKYMKKYNLKY